MNTITITDLLNAMHADTTPKCIGTYTQYNGGKQEFCAIGGAANILGQDASVIGIPLNSITANNGINLATIITELNDDPNLDLDKPTIAEIVAAIYPELLDKPIPPVSWRP